MSVNGSGARWDGHLLLLHATEQERQDGLVQWALRGLGAGEKVIWTESDEDGATGLLELLGGVGVDTVAALANGLLEPLSPSDFYPADGQETVVRRALDAGWLRVRMTAEAGLALSRMPAERYHSLEQDMDEMCRTLPVSAMCQYDRLRLDPAQVAGAVDLHLEGLRERQLSSAESRGVLALRGQVDAVNSDVLASTLRAACQRADRELRLDLSGLEFIDVSGARALASATSPFRAAGGRVVLADLQPPVARVLLLLRVDELSGLAVVEDRSS